MKCKMLEERNKNIDRKENTGLGICLKHHAFLQTVKPALIVVVRIDCTIQCIIQGIWICAVKAKPVCTVYPIRLRHSSAVHHVKIMATPLTPQVQTIL